MSAHPDSPTNDLPSIADLRSKPERSSFDVVALVQKCEVTRLSNGSPAMRLELSDVTGSFSCMVWSNTALFQTLKDSPASGMVVVSGEVSFYQNALSPRLFRVTPVPAADQERFVVRVLRVSPRPIEEMRAEFAEAVAAIEDVSVRKAVESVIDCVGPAFFTSPAAKSVHHSYRGGLLEHTLGLRKVSESLMASYDSLPIARDQVRAAVLLHDVAKVFEYTQDGAAGKTAAGLLEGHVAAGYGLWLKAAIDKGVDPAVAQRIGHAILAHHGEMEFGSPVKPHTVEAWIVHLADLTDARMIMLRDALSEAPDSAITERKPFMGELVR